MTAVPVRLGEQSYEVLVAQDLLREAGRHCRFDRKVMIVTDDGVPEAYARYVAASCASPFIHTFRAGEQSKTFETLQSVLSHMLRENFTRTDCVVAVGGGVAGDLAGLAASLYMRGVDFYNIPTTVLAQVDSAVGGKTAVDLEGAKNVVGTFYQPKKVLIDPAVLSTLPPRQVANGLAEAVKIAATCDETLFAFIENALREGSLAASLEHVITESVRLKAAVVEKDEKESGLRRVLNFGHTLGHAVEACAGFGKLLHGECVAVGMLPLCSESAADRLRPVLTALSLPTSVSVDPESVFAFLAHDKKADGDTVTAVFVDKIGSFRFEKLPLADMKPYIARLSGKS